MVRQSFFLGLVKNLTQELAMMNEYICADMLAELARREKAANIKPDPDIDIYMKVRL